MRGNDLPVSRGAINKTGDERQAAIKVGQPRLLAQKYLQASLKSISPGFSARNPKFLARDNRICVSALWYMAQATRQAGFAGACMSRDDLLFWFSIVWFLGLCGAAVWAFLWL